MKGRTEYLREVELISSIVAGKLVDNIIEQVEGKYDNDVERMMMIGGIISRYPEYFNELIEARLLRGDFISTAKLFDDSVQEILDEVHEIVDFDN